MLVSLLPGLRQLRAPLAAGYLWLTAAWILLEPRVSEKGDAGGVVASLYRAGDALPAAAVGIALSVLAYLVGSLSTSALSGRLRATFSVVPGAGPSSHRSALTHQAQAALDQVAARAREQMQLTLALSATNFDEFLRLHATASEQTKPRRSSWRAWLRHPVTRLRAKLRKETTHLLPGPGHGEPVDPNVERDAILAAAVVRDLNVVATTRLLGRDDALFSAVDRSRAEVDFRLALIPPLFASVLSVGIRSELWLLALLAPLGVVLSTALLADALRNERAANEILLDAIADDRVPAPSIERLQQRAASLATARRLELAETAAREVSVDIADAFKGLDDAGRSEPALALDARKRVDRAASSFRQLQALIPQAGLERGQDTIDELRSAAEEWVALVEGHGAPEIHPKERVAVARKHFTGYRADVRDALDALRATEQAKTDVAIGDVVGTGRADS